MSKELFLEKARRLSFLSAPLCFLSFCFLDFSFRYLYRFLGITSVLAWKPNLFTVCWALLFTGLTALLPRLARRIAMVALILLYSVLVIVHAAMYNIFGKLFTLADVSFAGDGAAFFSWSYLSFRKALLAAIVFAVLMMAAAAFLVPEKAPDKKARLVRKSCAGAAALLGLALILALHGFLAAALPSEDEMWWGNTFDPNSEAEIYGEFTDSNSSMMLAGLYQYTFRNFMVSYGIGEDHTSEKELTAYYESREVSGDNDMTGVLQGKNLIMVMMESIDTWLCTEDYMPNLYALQQRSVDFENHYTPLFLSAGTFNTEIITLTGLVPAVSGLASRAYSTNSFPLSLPALFTDAGYAVNSFHSASPHIYSRGSIHTNMGFAAYHSFVEMGMDDPALDSQMIGGYDQMVSDGPFYSYIITYSGHGPYTSEQENIAAPHMEQAKAAVARSGVTGSAANMDEYTRAVAHAMETDELVGELLERLEADGHIDDTVLVFYGDHYAKYMTDSDFLMEVKGLDGTCPADLYHTPCFLYAAGLEPQKVEKYVSSVDMVPTLVNLFGLDADRRYYVGDDIFGEGGGWVPLPNYSWYDGETYYSGDYAGEVSEEIAQRNTDLRLRLNASWDALKTNYFASGLLVR